MGRTAQQFQHWVPQFYLRRFAATGNQIFVFDKLRLKSYSAPVERVGGSRGFYEIPAHLLKADVPKDLPSMEDALSKSEARHADTLRQTLDAIEARTKLDEDLRADMALRIVLQHIRTPEYRIRHQQFIEAEGQAVVDLLVRANGLAGRCHFRYKEEHAPLDQALAHGDVDDIARLTKALLHHVWLIGEAAAEPLYTSDNPVLLIANGPEAVSGGGRGFAAFGAEVVYPLSAKYALILLEREYWKDLVPAYGTVSKMPLEQIRRLNEHQVRRSTQYVFSSADEWTVALQICTASPEVCDPNRPRWRVTTKLTDPAQATRKRPPRGYFGIEAI